MLLPIAQPLDIAVTLVYTVDGETMVANGALVWYEPEKLVRIQLNGTTPPPILGTDVRLHGVLDTTLRSTGRLWNTEGASSK